MRCCTSSSWPLAQSLAWAPRVRAQSFACDARARAALAAAPPAARRCSLTSAVSPESLFVVAFICRPHWELRLRVADKRGWRVGVPLGRSVGAFVALRLVLPREAVAADECARGRRPPAAGNVRLDALVVLRPALADGVDPTPGGIELIAPHEKRQVSLYDIGEQALVRIETLLFEGACEIERQVHWLQAHRFARHFRENGERDALLRLQANHESIRRATVSARRFKDRVRDVLERHHDLGHALLQPLSRAQVERNAGPTPGVD